MKPKKAFILSGIFLAIAVVFSVVVSRVNVRPVEMESDCPSSEISDNDSSCTEEETKPVGLATLNESVRSLFSYDKNGINQFWYKFTNISGAFCVLPAVYFGCLGLYEVVKRKSLKKVDLELKLLAVFYIVVVAVYFIFDHLIIVNYRPTSPLEPSYPSSHTLFAITICGSAILILRRLYKNKKSATRAKMFLAELIIATVLGRLLAGVHWYTDILGGIFISIFLLSAFYTALVSLEPKNKPANSTPLAKS